MTHKEPTYGELSVKDNIVETVIPSQNTFVQFTGFDTSGMSRGITVSNLEDDQTVKFDVICLINVSISSVAADSGGESTFEFQVFRNDGTDGFVNLVGKRSIDGGAPGKDQGSISISGIVSLQSGDTIELWVRNLTNSRNILITDCTMSAVRTD